MPRHEKLSKKSLQAISSQNLMREGVGSEGEEKEDALEWRGFRDRVNLHLGAIEQTNKRKRERERRKKAPNKSI